jgi:hypothetical protein
MPVEVQVPVQSPLKVDNRKFYDLSISRKLTPEQATLLLVGHA